MAYPSYHHSSETISIPSGHYKWYQSLSPAPISTNTLSSFSLPVFSGGDGVSWLRHCNRQFRLYDIPERNQVYRAWMVLAGEALLWFNEWQIGKDSLRWIEFCVAVLNRFPRSFSSSASASAMLQSTIQAVAEPATEMTQAESGDFVYSFSESNCSLVWNQGFNRSCTKREFIGQVFYSSSNLLLFQMAFNCVVDIWGRQVKKWKYYCDYGLETCLISCCGEDGFNGSKHCVLYQDHCKALRSAHQVFDESSMSELCIWKFISVSPSQNHGPIIVVWGSGVKKWNFRAIYGYNCSPDFCCIYLAFFGGHNYFCVRELRLESGVSTVITNGRVMMIPSEGVFSKLHFPILAVLSGNCVIQYSSESLQLSYDTRGNSVPTILLLMQRRLYNQGGLQAEGIFKINGGNSQEDYFRDQLNGGVQPEGVDVHYLAALIKAWFRELPTGVMDSLQPERVMQCQTEAECAELVRHLPTIESALLGLREWYSWHFSELVNIVSDNYLYTKLVKFIEDKSMLYEDKLSELTEILSDEDKAKEVVEAAMVEIVSYFMDSFGNSSRIDHEMNFFPWFYRLARIGIIKVENHQAVVASVFFKCIHRRRKLQLVFCLEPDGFHSVWGLDDYHFMSIILGSSQMIDHRYMKPKSIHNDNILDNFAPEYMYISCSAFIKKVKKGLSYKHSLMLDDISGPPNWKNVNGGTAGRAGRYCSRFLIGDGTCLDGDDLLLLHSALQSPSPLIERAGLLNLCELLSNHIEAFELDNVSTMPILNSERVYLLKGVSREILLQLVTKMITEYIPLCKDVIMQNESPGDLYIIESGEVEMIDCDFDNELVVGSSQSAEMFGVVGSLWHRPQSFISRHPLSSVRFGFSSGFKGSGVCWYWIFWVSRLGTLMPSHSPLASFAWLSAWGQAEFQKWGRGRYDKEGDEKDKDLLKLIR